MPPPARVAALRVVVLANQMVNSRSRLGGAIAIAIAIAIAVAIAVVIGVIGVI